MIRKSTINIILILFSLCFLLQAAVPYLKSFTFNEDNALNTWGMMVLNGQVKYMLVRAGSDGYIRALSEKSCSAIYYRLGFKLQNYPVLSWKWQVLKFPDTSKARTTEEKNDYAARVYVIFPFFTFSTSRFIEYVWAKDIPQETILDSPAGKNVKTIVVRSGMAQQGGWVKEMRNVYDDYLKAFGKKPTISVGAIAIMCDADSSKTTAESLFDDIVIARQAAF